MTEKAKPLSAEELMNYARGEWESEAAVAVCTAGASIVQALNELTAAQRGRDSLPHVLSADALDALFEAVESEFSDEPERREKLWTILRHYFRAPVR